VLYISHLLGNDAGQMKREPMKLSILTAAMLLATVAGSGLANATDPYDPVVGSGIAQHAIAIFDHNGCDASLLQCGRDGPPAKHCHEI
jgi:hypothetical protein